MEETASTASSGASHAEESGARWDRKAGTIATVVRVEGTLELLEPLHLGGMDDDEPENVSDLPLLTDPRTGKPLLPGATLAGALRSYLDARGHEFPAEKLNEERSDQSLATALFGERDLGGRGVEDPAPSVIQVDDALGEMPDEASVELYEGNRLAGATRTAAEGALYSRTAWPAGTTFQLHFEMHLPADEEVATRYCTAFISALHGLEEENLDKEECAGIRLGARKRRGFGRVRMHNDGDWRIRLFDLSDPEDFLLWIRKGNEPLCKVDGSRPCDDVAGVRDVLKGAFKGTKIIPDARRLFFVEVTCNMPHGLLDRTGGMTGEPDMVHRRAYDVKQGKERPVLTGTQVGGALRARAHRIARTLGPDGKADELVESVFGSDPESGEKGELRAGRLWINRSFIDQDDDSVGLMGLVQNRIQLDPWTQAPAHGALFNEQPVRGGKDMEVTLRWRLDLPGQEEPGQEESKQMEMGPVAVGLLLHLLKDLWMGDLAVAGTQSIGRGRFSGRSATLTARKGSESVQSWKLKATSDAGPGLQFEEGARQDLSRYADALTNYFDPSTDGSLSDTASTAPNHADG